MIADLDIYRAAELMIDQPGPPDARTAAPDLDPSSDPRPAEGRAMPAERVEGKDPDQALGWVIERGARARISVP